MDPDVPPLLSPEPKRKRDVRHLLAALLSLCLGVFLIDAAVSFADDLLIVAFGSHIFSLVGGVVSIASLLMGLGIYLLIGVSPMVPKRLFLPIPFFYLAAMLAVFPVAIYCYGRLEQIALIISACQVGVGLLILSRAQGGLKFRWPLVPVEKLGVRFFSWRNFSAFVLGNFFVLLPLVIALLFACAARAVDHFSEGFVALHLEGLTVQVRKYVRDDGKVIELFPMAHVASPDFYQKVSQSFPSNSIILMEGVTDQGNLLTNKISYKRMAKALGLAEQKQAFTPVSNQVVRADVDVGQFSKQTVDFLNLVMLIHTKGVTHENLVTLMDYSPSPDFEQKLFDDLLTGRNQHLLVEIQHHLQSSDNLMVPWGAAHMPGIAKGIQKEGFHLAETHEYVVIPFWKKNHAGNISGQ